MSDYRWVDRGNGRQTLVRVKEPRESRRSDLAAPMVLGAFAEPVQSAANGKWYTSKTELARSHKASGNPHGVDFIELGNDSMPWVEHTTSEAELREDVRSAVADVKAGKLPEVVSLSD
jgi:hypothetical protein